MKEYKQGLAVIVLLVAIVAFSSGPTGMYSLKRVQFMKAGGPEYSIERPSISPGLIIGEQIAPEHAEWCTEEMKWAGRKYESYLRCCQDRCIEPCKKMVDAYEMNNCVTMCGRTCRDIMTQAYLDLKPGTWR